MNLSTTQNYILRPSFFLCLSIGILVLLPIISYSSSFYYEEEDEEDCDICGCATSGGGIGFSSLQTKDFFGVRYAFQEFRSRDGIFNNSPIIREQFNTYQLWGKKQLWKNIELSVLVPFQDLNRMHTQRPDESVSGLGDINLIGWYSFNFYKKQSEDEPIFASKELSSHQLKLGLGVKLPTGKFRQEIDNGINPGFQVGSGSTDLIVSSLYAYTKERWGFSSNLSYFIKTENSDRFRFGNQLSLSSRFFLPIGNEKLAYFPFLGLTADHYNTVEEFGEKIKGTDGHLISMLLGTEISYKGYMLGANLSIPTQQNLVSGDVRAKTRFEIYVNFSF